MKPWEMLKAEAEKIGILLNERQIEQFAQYAGLLQAWNEKMNLTAITDPMEIAVKHFLDSIWPLHYMPLSPSIKMIDVGTGAGFPALPLAIAVPGTKPVLMDSLQKRLRFLQAVCEKLQIKAELVHERAEDGGRKDAFRERFDLAVARAVAPLPVLCEYCLPFVKQGGVFAAWKGPDGPAELEKSYAAIQKLGGKLKETLSYSLCDGSNRTLILIQKVRECPGQFPRIAAKIKKEPL